MHLIISRKVAGQFSAQERDYKDVEAEIRKCVGKYLNIQGGPLSLVVTGKDGKKLSAKINKEHFDLLCIVRI